jgi:hypothetical protein
MDRVAAEYPDSYLAIAAHLVPKEVTATIEAGHGGLDPADYAILQAIKESLPADPRISWCAYRFLLKSPRPLLSARLFASRAGVWGSRGA